MEGPSSPRVKAEASQGDSLEVRPCARAPVSPWEPVGGLVLPDRPIGTGSPAHGLTGARPACTWIGDLAIVRRMSSTRSGGSPSTWIDAAVCLAVFVAVVAYFTAWPHVINPADESNFLHEAKRVSEGDALYRDVFYFAMPGAHWWMALVFSFFGVTMDVARTGMAIVYGLTCVVLYVATRRLDVGPLLALTPPFATVALCVAAWPYASPHWLSTAFAVPLLLFVSRGLLHPDALFAGLLVGAIACVYQQKAIFFFAGVVAFALVDAAAGRRFADTKAPGARAEISAGYAVLFLAAGAALLVAPVLAVMVGTAGIERIVEDTLLYPFVGYRKLQHGIAWGSVSILTRYAARFTNPTVLALLPLVGVVNLGRALLLWLRRGDRRDFRRQLGLGLLVAAAAGSILYGPDFIHLAFIAPLPLVSAAEFLHRCARRLGAVLGGARLLEAAVAAAILVPLSTKATSNLRTFGAGTVAYAGEFGRVDFADERPIALVREVDALLRLEHTREIFVYPACSFVYLLADADNPTPYDLLLMKHNPPAQHAEVVRILEERDTRYVVVCPRSMRGDLVLPYVLEHYECIYPQGPPCLLYRRRP